jgi:hypothetical protein
MAVIGYIDAAYAATGHIPSELLYSYGSSGKEG